MKTQYPMTPSKGPSLLRQSAYFQTCREAIKAADPNHLVLGGRFAGYAPTEVMEAMAEFVDVVSYNNYGLVNVQDKPWTLLVTRVQEVNARIEDPHRRASSKEGR